MSVTVTQSPVKEEATLCAQWSPVVLEDNCRGYRVRRGGGSKKNKDWKESLPRPLTVKAFISSESSLETALRLCVLPNLKPNIKPSILAPSLEIKSRYIPVQGLLLYSEPSIE
jgi:hypothetical protein